MHKSSKCRTGNKDNSYSIGKNPKGQWFIISAIVISGALLAVSFIFRGFFVTDTSLVQLNDESYYFYAVNESISNIDSSNSDCAAKTKDMEEMKYATGNELIKKGILLRIEYSCITNKISTKLLLLHSENMETWAGRRPEIASAAINGNSVEVNVKTPVAYAVTGSILLYDRFGNGALREKKSFTIPEGNAKGTAAFTAAPQPGNYIAISSIEITGKKDFIL